MSMQIYLEKFAEKAWDIANDPDFDQFEACTALKDAALAIKQAQESIAALEREVNEQCRLNGMGAEREASLLSKVASLEKDAARYQMIRNNVEALDTRDVCIFDRDGWEIHGLIQGDDLDQEIDTAMEASNAKAD